jgi:hypothetical protein
VFATNQWIQSKLLQGNPSQTQHTNVVFKVLDNLHSLAIRSGALSIIHRPHGQQKGFWQDQISLAIFQFSNWERVKFWIGKRLSCSNLLILDEFFKLLELLTTHQQPFLFWWLYTAKKKKLKNKSTKIK